MGCEGSRKTIVLPSPMAVLRRSRVLEDRPHAVDYDSRVRGRRKRRRSRSALPDDQRICLVGTEAKFVRAVGDHARKASAQKRRRVEAVAGHRIAVDDVDASSFRGEGRFHRACDLGDEYGSERTVQMDNEVSRRQGEGAGIADRDTHGGSVRKASSDDRSEEHTSELQSLRHLVCRLLLEKKKASTQLLTPANDFTPSTAGRPAPTSFASPHHRPGTTAS